MPVDAKLIDILCCPVSKTPVGPLDKARLKKLNKAISDGDVQYVDGSTVADTFNEALITDDRKVIYPVVNGFPMMLQEKGIGTTQLNDF